MIIRTPLNYRTSCATTIGELIFAPLEDGGITPLVVDAGARNGMFLLPDDYARRATLVGFEPNSDEYKKLVDGRTDAQEVLREAGHGFPKFRQERYFDCALWDREETRQLFITRGAGACTMMGPTLPLMDYHYYQYSGDDPRRKVSFYDLHSEVVGTEEVKCQRLDALLDGGETIDFLKIDVEGSELHVLRGAEELLASRRILFVQTEFQVFPYYESHPLFGDQHRFLSEYGFRLLDINLDHPRYRRGAADLTDGYDRNLLLAGDALFALDPDREIISPLNLHRIAAMALVFGFTSFGLSLLRDASLLNVQELERIEAALRGTPLKSWKGRLAEKWARIPYRAYAALEPILRIVRQAIPH